MSEDNTNPPAPQVESGLDQLTYAERYKFAREEIPDFLAKPELSSDAFVHKLQAAFDSWIIAEPDKLRLAFSKLKGNAAAFQVEMRETGQQLDSFSEFATRLRARFPVPIEEQAPFLLQHKVAMQGNALSKIRIRVQPSGFTPATRRRRTPRPSSRAVPQQAVGSPQAGC